MAFFEHQTAAQSSQDQAPRASTLPALVSTLAFTSHLASLLDHPSCTAGFSSAILLEARKARHLKLQPWCRLSNPTVPIVQHWPHCTALLHLPSCTTGFPSTVLLEARKAKHLKP